MAKDVAFLREKLSQRSKNIAGVFRRYDANGDGHLSAEELHRGFQDMGMDIGMWVHGYAPMQAPAARAYDA